MVSAEDIAALEAKRAKLLNQMRSVTRQIVQARNTKRVEERTAREDRLARIASMMQSMTIAEIALWETLSISRTHALINEVKRRARSRAAKEAKPEI